LLVQQPFLLEQHVWYVVHWLAICEAVILEPAGSVLIDQYKAAAMHGMLISAAVCPGTPTTILFCSAFVMFRTGLRNMALVTADAFEAACCANAAWLEDVIMHLLCVLALDRFADYVSDQVGVW
jgi:hypothetical protein